MNEIAQLSKQPTSCRLAVSTNHQDTTLHTSGTIEGSTVSVVQIMAVAPSQTVFYLPLTSMWQGTIFITLVSGMSR